MKVLELLRSGTTLEDLQDKYGIRHTKHEDGRVILNYHQIDSYKHKFDPIVRECRGLVTHVDGWPLIARAFERFFNLGEDLDGQKGFNWTNCVAQHKEDGSLIIVYYWNGSWHINTKGSFGDGEVSSSGII